MIEVVLDASVVLKWFRAPGEAHLAQARRLRTDFETGSLRVLAPSILWLEVLNAAGRRWLWTSAALQQLAHALAGIGFEAVDPDLPRIARWVAEGLTAYDAAYVAIAEQSGTRLITDDALILRVAGALTTALSEVHT